MNTTTAFQLKYNRSSVHVAGITERTQVSGDGMNYAQSACPSLTRHLSFMVKDASDDLAEALEMARLTARVQGLKLCKHCEKAAEKQIAEQPVTEVAEAPKQTVKVAIIKDSKGNERVHSAECRDVKVEATKFRYDPYFMQAATREDVALDWYADIASDNYEEGTPEWNKEILDCMNMAMIFLPCCNLPHEDEKAEEQVAEAPTRKLGKAQRRVLDFLSARPGQTMVVSLIVKGLEAEGIKTWFRATNDALAKLAQDPTSGIVEVTGGNKAYKFER